MRVFLDTNILLDILMPDRTLSSLSKHCITQIIQHHDGYIAAISINNIQYVTRKYLTKEQFQRFYSFLDTNFTIVELTKSILDESIDNYDKDFEDQIQITSASYSDCDVIITNNIKDFSGIEDIQIYTPQNFLERYKS